MPENGIEISIDRVDEAMRNVRAVADTRVLVGIPSNTAGRRDGPITNAALGYIHEFGSPARNIPARPFLVPAVNAIVDDVAKMLQVAAAFQLDGEPEKAQQTFEAIGLKAQSAVKLKIVTGPFTPNKPATIAAKGSDKPLIDTAQMLNSITYVVRKNAG